MSEVRITTGGHDIAVGDIIEIQDERRWWLRAWHWITRRKATNTFIVVEATATTLRGKVATQRDWPSAQV